MKRFAVGVDVGGTKIAYGLVDENRAVVASRSHPSDTSLECGPFFDRIAAEVDALLGQAKSEGEVAGIGVGMPSFIHYEKGYIVKTSALLKIKDFPARDYLAQKTGRRIFLDNDARAAALAEHRLGAGRGFDNMLFCPVSTGISSAMLINGTPFRGSYGWAGETGHMVATPGEGIECGCGNRGCYMSWCSGGMIVKHIRAWIAAGEKTAMLEMAAGDPEKIDSIVLEKAYDAGDALAARAFNQMVKWFGVWFYNLYVSFNINCFVLGGGLVNMGDKFLKPIRKEFDKYNKDDFPVYFKTAECKKDAGILGAAEFVWEKITLDERF